MRQQQGQAVHGAPLVLAGAQELVPHDLGSVVEVPKLRLPDREAVRLRKGVPVFKAAHGILRKQAVVNLEFRLVLAEVVEHDQLFLAVFGLDHGVAVGERPTLDILSADAHGVPLVEEGRVGQFLTHRPVELVAVDHGLTVLHEFFDLAEELLVFRQRAHACGQINQFLLCHPGLGRRRQFLFFGWPVVFPELAQEIVHHGQFHGLGFFETSLHGFAQRRLHGVRVLGGHRAVGQQFLQVNLPRRRVGPNGLVQLGLGELGFVAFVVAVLPVAQQVDEHVALERLAVIQGDVHHLDHGLHVVGVHVKDQPLGDLGHVGAVGRRSCVKVVGGEAHLVVHHEVHGATCAVAVQACHLGHLVHHTLARDGRVAVDEDGQHTGFVAAMGVDACTGDAFHHRVHRLEVRGVGRQSDGHLFTGVRHLLA